MYKHPYVLIICISACIVFSGCGGKADRSDVAIKINNTSMTQKDIEDRISKLPQHYQELVKKNKRAYIDELIVDNLLYEEAKMKGLDRDKELREVLLEARKKIMIARLLKDEVSDKIIVTDAEISAYYEDNKARFVTPETLRASHILVKTEDEAKRVLSEAGKGRDFAELAKEYSIDPTAKNGGDIGEFRQGDLVPNFEEECFKLGIGRTSGIVKTQFGYHIIKLTDRRPPEVKNLEEVKDAVRDILYQMRRKEIFGKLIEKLKEKSKIEINEKVIDTIGGEKE